MAKHLSKKGEIRSSRISLMFFHALLLCLLLWVENFAYYRFDYIFRGMLPWILPIAFLLSIALLVYLLLQCKKKTEQKRVFSPKFKVLLALPLPAIFVFPWLASFGKGLQLFKIAILLLFLGVIAYFIGYLLYHLVRPAAALLCGAITANALALTYFYRMYLSPARYILHVADYGYLPAWGAALILCGILGVLLLIVLYINRSKSFRFAKPVLVAPAGLTALLLIGLTIADPWLSGLWIRILLFGGIGLMVLWLMIQCILLSMKKK